MTRPPALLAGAYLTLAAALAAAADAPGPPSPPATEHHPSPSRADHDRALYSLGVMMSSGLERFELSEAELRSVIAGLTAGVHHQADVEAAQKFNPQLQQLQRERILARSAREESAGKLFADKAAQAPGAVQSASGLIYREVRAGTGPSPTGTDQVKVNYEGRLIDGTVFDSSKLQGQPVTFDVGRVIPCFTEALLKMKTGGLSHIVCPAKIAYGARGAGPKIAPGATLQFDIELLEVLHPANAGAADDDDSHPAQGSAPATVPSTPDKH